MVKDYVFVIQSAPSEGFSAEEGLDMALSFASFGDSVTLIFEDKGCLHLNLELDFGLQQRRNYQRVIEMLPIYDIPKFYIFNSPKKTNISKTLNNYEYINEKQYIKLIQDKACVFYY